MIAGAVPSVIAMAVSTAVQVATKAARDVQVRQRSNNFLDRMNTELFQPAGLFAMVFKYKPTNSSQTTITAESVDIRNIKAIAKYFPEEGAPKQSGMKEQMNKLRLASGKTHGEVEMPESAPLIFPAVEEAVAKEGEQKFKDKMKGKKDFLIPCTKAGWSIWSPVAN